MSYAQGAGVYVPYATALRALFQRASAEPREVVLVHGATGGVGGVVIGCRGTVEINPRELMVMNASDDEAASIHVALVAGLSNQTLRPVVGRKFPLADAPKAHHEVMESRAYGKIVLIPS